MGIHQTHINQLPGFNHLSLVDARLGDLVVPDRVLRAHPKEQINKIARSIEEFGFVTPILVDSRNNIVAGVARIMAARQLGLGSAPAIRIEHLTDAQIRVFRIADNRLCEDANWDREALKFEIEELLSLDIDLGLTGFEMGEIDVLLDGETPVDRDTQLPELPTTPVSEVGDIWTIGDHTLICGDATKSETYAMLEEKPVDAVFTDAPYNVKIDKNVCGLGTVRHDEFVQASGEMSLEEFASFLRSVHDRLAENTKPGGIIFSCMDWRSISPLILAGEGAGLELINLAVWDKSVGGMGSLYRSQHELICVFKKPGASHTTNVQLGKHGRNRTNVWPYAGMNSGTKARGELLKLHPTVKPAAMVADAIKDVTSRGDRILDCFGGSGTTMVAAQDCGRSATLIELDPKYVDVIIERMSETFRIRATLHDTDESFEAVRARRVPPTPIPLVSEQSLTEGQKGASNGQ